MQHTIHDDFFKDFIVATATVSSISEIPNSPGIYAFYHAFDFSHEKLFEDIGDRISTTVFNTKFSEENNRKKFVIDTCGKPIKLSDAISRFIKDISMPRQRRELSRLLLVCSILQAPDYIGTTKNSLQERFKQHLDEDEGFFSKYGNSRSQQQFLFICLPCRENVSRELESLLIQLCQPKFNAQRS
jgi:hypothetical protein